MVRRVTCISTRGSMGVSTWILRTSTGGIQSQRSRFALPGIPTNCPSQRVAGKLTRCRRASKPAFPGSRSALHLPNAAGSRNAELQVRAIVDSESAGLATRLPGVCYLIRRRLPALAWMSARAVGTTRTESIVLSLANSCSRYEARIGPQPSSSSP